MRSLSTVLCGLWLFLGVSIASAEEPTLQEMLPAYAKVFSGNGKAPFQIPHKHLLDITKLDGSIASLTTVDAYLAKLTQADVALSIKEISMVSLLAGSYVGEVIIKASNKGHHWVPFSEYVKTHPTTQRTDPGNVYTEYLLVSKGEAFTTPINDVAHLLDSGKVFNVAAFATAQLK
ncbi:hypothetical protein A9Q99_06640 [Gammaproteobacteria bacterium 45_16_T64]|nr:hypothetical protein A9Q99_06640 [Gammaproteobacteria bacterium 45_16_T64]